MNLVELIGKAVPGDTLSRIGTAAGLGPDETRKVASGAVPLVAAGLAQVGSTEGGAGRLLDLARRTGSEDLVDRFGGMLGSDESRRSLTEQGGGILSSLFGSQGDSLLDAFTQHTGAPRGGTKSFLSMLAPLALGVLGRQARSQGLGASGLASMLAGQSGLLANMLPGGLGKLLGDGMLGGTNVRAEEQRPREVATAVRATGPALGVKKRSVGMPAVLLAIAVAFLAWALLRPRTPPAEQARATAPAEPAAGMAHGTAIQGIDALASYTGTDLEGRHFGLTATPVEAGSTQLTPESTRQVDKLAGVMKQRQGIKVRLEGERADPVRDALAERGITAERVTTSKTSTGPAADKPELVEVVVTAAK